ncbi:MFS transporter [Lacinutrix neustonica]|uniref:MFS transporter n=1 Tax=Lacinutrix neustonica TaxID=2980107 RepID=A0A9E8SED6_9FLAO|nr:MFS transporter [Lacinutrix neustonica]WAC02612.1 MFS transporter [Lacinutrix neustonica]
MNKKKNTSSALTIILLILAGEAVFILPFVLQRLFRSTFLETFTLNQTQLGSCFSVYGIVALFSYLFGGPLADRFRPHLLISVALILTALGGLYLTTYPTLLELHILYGFWGFTTIFLFWAAMIKATVIWGGRNHQGMAFGFLDGGRGLVAALFGSIGVLMFSLFISKDIELTSIIERQEAFISVVLYLSYAIIGIAFLVFFFLRFNTVENNTPKSIKVFTLENFKIIMKFRTVWLLMIIIICAYYAYKMTDLFSQYAEEVMLYNKMESAKIGTYLLYMRPVIGVSIGLLADRTRASLWLSMGFILMTLTALIFASGIIDANGALFFVLSIGIMALGVYSARVLYFATLEEGKIPIAITGTAVGFISVVGYTPDIFAGLLYGYFLDAYKGEETGYQIAFAIMAGFCFIGLLASLTFYMRTRNRPIGNL